MHWNEFFQFVIFFSFAPMVALFYTLLNTVDLYQGQIMWNHILRLTTLLGTNGDLDESTYELFDKLDLYEYKKVICLIYRNADGQISLKNFFNFVGHTYILWEPLYIFRGSLLNFFFPDNLADLIFKRRAALETIKMYKSLHHNHYPPESCMQCLTRVWNGLPNPSHYDYWCDPVEISFSDLTTIIIQKYNPTYIYKKETFPLKYLTFYRQFPYLGHLDQFYMVFKKQLPQNSKILRSSTSSFSNYDSSKETRQSSILKSTNSNYTRKVTAETQATLKAHIPEESYGEDS